MSTFEFPAEPIADAYRLMAMDAEGHVWSKFAKNEISAILQRVKLEPHARVVDVGCGSGRHAIELAQQGFRVRAFDFVSAWIDRVKSLAAEQHEAIELSGGELKVETHDARQLPLMEVSDLVVCLYDVIGSTPAESDAEQIVQSLFRLCKPGGWVVVGCMNGLQMIRGFAPECLVTEVPNKADLIPVSAMQRCGEVFDFHRMRYQPQTGTLFRREQFEENGQIVLDALIAERRFLPCEIVRLLTAAGFEDVQAHSVRAGQWDFASAFDPDAPEVVYVGRRSANITTSIPRLPLPATISQVGYTLQLIPKSEVQPQHAAIVSRIFCTSFGKNPKTGRPHILGAVRSKVHESHE